MQLGLALQCCPHAPSYRYVLHGTGNHVYAVAVWCPSTKLYTDNFTYVLTLHGLSKHACSWGVLLVGLPIGISALHGTNTMSTQLRFLVLLDVPTGMLGLHALVEHACNSVVLLSSRAMLQANWVYMK